MGYEGLKLELIEWLTKLESEKYHWYKINKELYVRF